MKRSLPTSSSSFFLLSVAFWFVFEFSGVFCAAKTFLADIGPLAWTRFQFHFVEYVPNAKKFLHGDLFVFDGNCNRLMPTFEVMRVFIFCGKHHYFPYILWQITCAHSAWHAHFKHMCIWTTNIFLILHIDIPNQMKKLPSLSSHTIRRKAFGTSLESKFLHTPPYTHTWENCVQHAPHSFLVSLYNAKKGILCAYMETRSW